MQSEFSTEVKVNDFGVEATELGLDEVEDFFVPSELIETLPETLVYEIRYKGKWQSSNLSLKK